MKTKLLLLSGTGISRLGDFMYLVALNWMVLNDTKSPTIVAGLWLMGPLAAVCTKFWSGSIVDRLNKRSIMIITDIIRAFCICSIPFFSSIWPIYFCIFLTHIATSFFGTASFTYTATLIPREERQQFNAWNSLSATGSFVIGPALAGLLMAVYSPQFVIFCNGISFLISALIIYFLPNISLHKNNLEDKKKTFVHTLKADWKQVFSFARTQKYVMLIYILFQATLLIAMALDSQEVVFSKQVLDLTEREYSMLVSLTGAGYVLGSFIASLFAKKLQLQYCIGIGMIVMAIGYVIYAFSSSFIMAVSGFIVLGIFSSIANTGFFTFYQNSIPLDMMGRIESVFDAMKNFVQIVFILAIGTLAEVISIQFAVIGSALFILFFSCILALWAMVPSRSKHYVSTESSVDF
ncbi:MFS transporter [Bacillus sp. DX4.1]|uniref:MFS transporter n=1 Tax=Bacillus sp. DX4.1 TaxID=3055867 RepID=UPI0025A0A17E|nr:MFS transporter [Bacillus sp. DX4.1]MDM5187941.1 MFS transporter [Bacillus sp. DX4.1]